MSWIQADADWQRTWAAQPSESEDILDTLQELDARFVKALASVMSGDVLLEDGTQHPFLAEIVGAVEMGKIPSESQRSAFLRVFGFLRRQQEQGFPLHIESDADKADRANASKKLVSIAVAHLDLFNERTSGIVASMTQHFRKFGTLTIGQLSFLKKIIETIPEHMLRH